MIPEITIRLVIDTSMVQQLLMTLLASAASIPLAGHPAPAVEAPPSTVEQPTETAANSEAKRRGRPPKAEAAKVEAAKAAPPSTAVSSLFDTAPAPSPAVAAPVAAPSVDLFAGPATAAPIPAELMPAAKPATSLMTAEGVTDDVRVALRGAALRLANTPGAGRDAWFGVVGAALGCDAAAASQFNPATRPAAEVAAVFNAMKGKHADAFAA